MTNLYSFFGTNKDFFSKDYMVNIDKSLENMNDIYNHIGKVIYGECPLKNPIFDGIYFGSNISSFFDCLSSSINIVNQNIVINILSKNEKIPDDDFFDFLNAFVFLFKNFELGAVVKVFVSKEILGFYLDRIEIMQNDYPNL